MSRNTTFFNQRLDEYVDLADVEILNDFLELLDTESTTTPKMYSASVVEGATVEYTLTPLNTVQQPSQLFDGFTIMFVSKWYHDASEDIYINMAGLPRKKLGGSGAIQKDEVQMMSYSLDDDIWYANIDRTEDKLFVNQIAHGFTTGDLVGNDGTKYVLSDYTDTANYTIADGICVVKDADSFFVAKDGNELLKIFGDFTDDLGNPIEDNTTYYGSPTVIGKATKIKPETSNDIVHAVFMADSSDGVNIRLNIVTNSTAFYGVQPMREFIQDADTLDGLHSADLVQIKTETQYTDAKIIGDKFRTLDNLGNVPQTRRIDTGAGLQGGGDLSQNRSISVKTADSSIISDVNGIKVDVSALFSAIYPIGCIYTSISSTSPSTLFGGTWERFAQGKTVVGVDEGDIDFNTVEKTGGSKSVTLTSSQLPSHTHTADHSHTGSSSSTGAHTHTGASHTHTTPNHTHTGSSNSTGAHTHTRGTMNITGTTDYAENYDGQNIMSNWSGAFHSGNVVSISGRSKIDRVSGTTYRGFRQDFNASRNWTGSTSSSGSHSHTITVNSGGGSTTGADGTGTTSSNGAHTHTITVSTATVTTSSVGSNESHTNLQPYITTYMWKRTA